MRKKEGKKEHLTNRKKSFKKKRKDKELINTVSKIRILHQEENKIGQRKNLRKASEKEESE